MTIQDLLDLIPPPETPLHNQDTGQFEALEAKYGFRFPESYREICRRYGSGAFDPAFADMHNPLDACYELDIESKLSYLHQCRQMAEHFDDCDRSCPYEIFPNMPGLFPWASSHEQGDLLWLVDSGNPENWPIIVSLRDGIDDDDTCWLRYDLSLADFLIQSSLWTLCPPYQRRRVDSTNGPKFWVRNWR